MSLPPSVRSEVERSQRTWLVTGCAGFIGSNLIELLLRADQRVVGLDNFATGYRRNLDEVRQQVGEKAWSAFRFIEGSIVDFDVCTEACRGVEIVLHQAALGSVPRSIADPFATNAANVTGFLNVMMSAAKSGVRRFVYAASSSTYGDHPALPKVEENIGRPLSPYAVTKYANELYADVGQRVYGVSCIGLRYFNVFGKRQDPDGAYAAVIPRWIGALLRGERCQINGDGETTRDFCYIENVLQANLLAAFTPPAPSAEVYNVAYGERTTLNDLYSFLRDTVAQFVPAASDLQPIYTDFRAGDVRHSLADISKARTQLGYAPTHSVRAGLAEAMQWYVENSRRRADTARRSD